MAGMSSLTLMRFTAYDVVGVAGYVAIYTAIGEMAGRSWSRAVQWVGTGGALLFAAVILLAWVTTRVLRRGSEAESRGDASPEVQVGAGAGLAGESVAAPDTRPDAAPPGDRP
jgi:hypothetical protein